MPNRTAVSGFKAPGVLAEIDVFDPGTSLASTISGPLAWTKGQGVQTGERSGSRQYISPVIEGAAGGVSVI